MKLKQFHIYTTDGATVEFTMGDLNRVNYDTSLFAYSLYDIEEIHAMTILNIVRGVRAEKQTFFASGSAIGAYCKACKIFAPYAKQYWV